MRKNYCQRKALIKKLCYCLLRRSSHLVVGKQCLSLLLCGPCHYICNVFVTCLLTWMFLPDFPLNSWPRKIENLCLYDTEFYFLILLELLPSQHHPGYYKSAFPNLTSAWCQLPYLFSAQQSPPDGHIKRLTIYITVCKTPQKSGQQPDFKRPWTNFWIVSHASS